MLLESSFTIQNSRMIRKTFRKKDRPNLQTLGHGQLCLAIPRCTKGKVTKKPLIDLSDEIDNSYSGTSDSKRSVASSEISSLFDSLCSPNTSHYGNIDLAQPLLKDPNYVSDPFEISEVYSKTVRIDNETKPKRIPPARPKPTVYRRNTSTESQHSGGSPQSFSPPKFSGIKSIPPEYLKRENPIGFEITGERKVSNTSISAQNSPSKHMSLKHIPNREFVEDIIAKHKDIKDHSVRQSVPQASNVYKDSTEKPRTVDKAFDWLNDALSSFSVSNTEKAGSDPALSKSDFPKYDQVPDEFCETGKSNSSVRPKVYSRSQVRTGYPVQYCEVPNEDSNKYYSRTPAAAPRYDEVPKYEDPKDIKLPIAKDIYSPQSTTSTYSDWDDFDSDLGSDNEETFERANNKNKNSPPPLPPRDYSHAGESQHHAEGDKMRPHILPILQDGHQLSHTHYFLIPSKNEKCHPGQVEKNTAQVRPFTIDGSQVDHITQSYSNYQNFNVKLPDATLNRSTARGSHSAENLHSDPTELWSTEGQEVDLTQSYPNRKHQYARSVSHGQSQDVNTKTQQDKITALQDAVIGLTDEECHAALCHCNWNVERSTKHLKIEQLFRLGLAPKDHCRKLLEVLHWNLELASSVMMDEYRAGPKISIESAV